MIALAGRSFRQTPTRLVHRAGPVELDGDRRVQRCLRCDRVLRVLGRKEQPLEAGARVTDGRCAGGVGVVLEYDE